MLNACYVAQQEKEEEEIINDRDGHFFATSPLTSTKRAKIMHENKLFFLVINAHLTICPQFCCCPSLGAVKFFFHDYELLLARYLPNKMGW